MRELVRNGTSWRPWFIETVVIVLSILLAFGIDAWWDERQERQEEGEILAGLQREFGVYRDKLENGLEKHEEMRAAIAALLTATESGQWTADHQSLDAALMRALWPPTTELGGGVRDALVQAGRLELLSDRALREKLALWPGVYAEILDDEVFSRELVFEHLLPYLTSEGYDLSAAVEGISSTTVTVAGIGTDEAETHRLLSDPRFRSLMQVRLGYWLHAHEEYRSALEAAEEILSLIETRGRNGPM